MRCYCCGKPLPETASEQELRTGWHDRCVRRFFGTSVFPEFDISEESLKRIAEESTNKGYTVPGVQKKLSLHLTADPRRPRLTLVNYPTGYILKPQTALYLALPEGEYLVMQMARHTGIATVPFALIRMGESGEMAYITRRIDRILPTRKKPELELLAMEDFCQLDQRLTEDKYRGSYERCAKVVERYSQQRGLDLSELFLRVVFSFATGNSDMHLKNFSLIETSPGSQCFVLSEAYDMLPVNVVDPNDEEQMALPLNGKKRNLHRNDFLKYAESIGISREAASKMIRKVASLKDDYLEMCEGAYLPDDMKVRFAQLIEERSAALRPAGENQG